MADTNDALYRFAKLVTPKKETNKEKQYNGTVVIRDSKQYVKIDGSDQLTPITSEETARDGERVTVTLKDHQAVFNNNKSVPSARNDDLLETRDSVTEIDNLIAYTVTAQSAEFMTAKIDNLIAETGKFEELSAVTAQLETLKARVANIGSLTADEIAATKAEFTNIQATIGKFTDISTETLEAMNVQINVLNANLGNFGYLSAEKLFAVDAEITNLKAEKLDAASADIRYANIDFANITEAAIEKLFTDSGIIKNLITKDGQITGELVGVTIKGDLIEGGTVKADKLVVKGSDGLFYKLNVDAMGTTVEEVPDDKLHGSVIVAKSITADQIAVSDLVAFGATIGGFKIGDHCIYSGVKSTVDNTTRGIYMDDSGQFAFGDGNTYLKYAQDSNGQWSLESSMSSESADIMVGGRNLALDSKNSYPVQTQDGTLWTCELSENSFTGGQYILSFHVEEYPDPDSIQQVRVNAYIYTYDGQEVIDQTIALGSSFPLDDGNTKDIVINCGHIDTTAWGSEADTKYIGIEFEGMDSPDLITMGWVKFEKGNIPTDWTPAPEDTEDATNAIAQNANNYTDAQIEKAEGSLNAEITAAQSTIQQLADSLTVKIVQTMIASDEWQTLSQNITSVTTTANGLNVTVSENVSNLTGFLDEFYTYFQLASDGITIGKNNSAFKTRLDNSKLSFLQSNQEVAYIQYNRLYVTEAAIKTLMVGYPSDSRYVRQQVDSDNVFRIKIVGG